MKPLLKFVILILLTVSGYTSCKKDYSCENCDINPSGNGTNKSPIGKAGTDQIVTFPTDSVLLDGSGSSDADGSISSFQWTKISGPASFAITSASAAKTVVKNLTAGTYQFELKVTDNGGLSAKDTMQVIVDDPSIPNRPPVANAGADQTITLPTNTITLNGNGSTDPDNNITSYLWTKISGPSSFNITNANTVQTQVTNLVQGFYQFELNVTDAGGLISKDTMQVTIDSGPVPLPPICSPGNRPLVSAQLVPLGTLSQSRLKIAIASAENKILFSGGYRPSTGTTSRVDIYDIITNTWSISELSLARVGIGTAVNNANIFFAGGTPDGYNNNESTRVDIYDASANSWSTTELSQPRSVIKGAVNGNKVLFSGGMYGLDYTSSVVDAFNTNSNTWSATTLSQHRVVGSATVINDKTYFAGGEVWTYTENATTSRIDIYNSTSNTWSVSELSLGRLGLAGIAVGNNNYWAGGVSDDWGMTNSVEIRDASTNNTTFECLFQPNANFDAVFKNNKIVFFTGSGIEKNKFDIYDLTTNTWSIGVLPVEIHSASIISVNNTIYVAGGYVNGVLSNQVWKLEF